MSKEYCGECNDYMNYFTKTEFEYVDVRGKRLCYVKTVAMCEYCKLDIFVQSIENDNVISLYDEIYKHFPPTEEDLMDLIKYSIDEAAGKKLARKHLPSSKIAQ